MEELRMLVEMVAGLPTLTVWVLLGYLLYQLSIMASIYATIRFVVTKVCEYLVVRKTAPQVEAIRLDDGTIITGAMRDLNIQIKRLRNRGHSTNSKYVHDCDIAWLSEAISEKEQRDAEGKK